jgi:mono/diheme cytochrome c family protein
LPVKHRGVLRLALFVCTVATGACAGSAPAAQQSAHAPDARQLFARACSKCHSADGTGGLPMAANGPRPINFHDPAWQASRSDAELVAAIRDGRGAMPPFADVLKPDEIAALASHIRALNPGTR